MKWTQTIPADRPVTWPQAKAHLRLDDDEQRDYVTELIEAAAAYAETTTGRSLTRRTVTATFYGQRFPQFPAYDRPPTLTPADPLLLPRGPIIALTSVTDAEGKDLTANATIEYEGNAVARLRVINATWNPRTLTVVYDAGYPTARQIPPDLRHAIKMHVSHLWNNPDAYAEKALLPVPAGLEAFYARHSWECGVG